MPDDNTPSPFDPGARSRGILTKKDREFLISREEYDEQTKRDKRYRIRNRIRDSYLDFSILNTFLPKKDRKSVFQGLEEDYTIWMITPALKFTYGGLRDLDIDFESVLENVIENYERGENPDVIPHVTVDIDIRTEEITVNDAIERLIQGEGTIKEFNFLMNRPQGLHQLADKLEEVDQDAKMRLPEDEVGPATLEAERIRDLAEGLSPSEED